MTARKKASGRNVPEAARHTVAVKLRLAPELAAALREGAARQGVTLSDWVAMLVASAPMR